MSGLIAIVGRPNVGKSALFNRIAGKRIAIVHDQPGVTRDRISAEVEWQGTAFTLVDTGGIGLVHGEKAQDIIAAAAFDQVNLAIDAAAAIIFVVNIQEGIVPLDRDVAQRLRRSGKPVLVAANKTDQASHDAHAPEFAALGFGQVFPVSAIHGRGVAELVGAAVKILPPGAAAAAADSTGVAPLKLAIVGRPNVGKSSLLNALTGSPRVMVTPIPGTTRDSVDVPFEVETEGAREKYLLIDTAGIRKERRIDDSIEFFSVKRTEASIERCDIVILVVDAESGVREQDKKIGDKIVEAHKPCIVVVNKWDLAEPEAKAVRAHHRRQAAAAKRADRSQDSLADFGRWVQKQLFFLEYAPVIFTSATTGYHLDRLLEAVRYVAAQLQQKIPTALLNRVLQQAVESRQPVSATGQRVKFFYATQTACAPPTFVLFVNRDELFSPPYQRYLITVMRRAFGFEGCPIILCARARPKTIEPKRKFKAARAR